MDRVNVKRSPDPVLVVDDGLRRREMLVEYLRFTGFNVHAVSDGTAALALASTLQPRVILMDLAMGDLDGLETTRRLRANASTKDVVIVAVTGRAFASDRNEAHRAGVDAVILKPFDVTMLPDYIDEILRTVGRPAPRIRH